MSLQFGSIIFDAYEGPVVLPRRRVATFATPQQPNAGSQVYPIAGSSFPVMTTRYEPVSLTRETATTFETMIGDIIRVIENGLDYSLMPYRIKFVIESLEHTTLDVIPRAVGRRGLANLDYSPAGRIVTQWTLRAVPA